MQMQKFDFDLDNLTSIFVGQINFRSPPEIRSLFSSGWEDFSGGISLLKASNRISHE